MLYLHRGYRRDWETGRRGEGETRRRETGRKGDWEIGENLAESPTWRGSGGFTEFAEKKSYIELIIDHLVI